jgi:curli biogenesis system outer membrane secretion channel CsgG
MRTWRSSWRGIGVLAGTALALAAAGCATVSRRGPAPPDAPQPASAYVVRPTLTVPAFEERAGFRGAWPVGEGLAEHLVTRLVESGDVIVLEPRARGSAFAQIARRGREFLRADDRAEPAGSDPARYRIHGVITDFAAAPDPSGWFPEAAGPSRGRRHRARVAITLRVHDIETGRVVGSVQAEGRSSASGTVDYPAVPFGSDAFFRTPLGRAADQALDRAALRLRTALPAEPWAARVAEGGTGTAIVNGGVNVGLREGAEFLVRAEGRRISDPVTGAPLETRPGALRGRLRIVEVRAAAATAVVIEGDASRGDFLEPAPSAGYPRPPR